MVPPTTSLVHPRPGGRSRPLLLETEQWRLRLRSASTEHLRAVGIPEILAFFSSISPPGISVASCGCLGQCRANPNLTVLPTGALIGHCGTATNAAQILAEICGPGFDPRRNLEALALRKKVEDALEKGNTAEAESLLSSLQAIDLEPSGGLHFIYKSRASARLTMGDKIGALEDAKRSSLLAPNFTQVPFLDVCNTQLHLVLPLTPADYEEFGYPFEVEDFLAIRKYTQERFPRRCNII